MDAGSPDEVGKQLAVALAELLSHSSREGRGSEGRANAEGAAVLISAQVASIPQAAALSGEQPAPRPAAAFLAERLVAEGQAVTALAGMLEEGWRESARLAAANVLFHMATRSELSQVRPPTTPLPPPPLRLQRPEDGTHAPQRQMYLMVRGGKGP